MGTPIWSGLPMTKMVLNRDEYIQYLILFKDLTKEEAERETDRLLAEEVEEMRRNPPKLFFS